MPTGGTKRKVATVVGSPSPKSTKNYQQQKQQRPTRWLPVAARIVVGANVVSVGANTVGTTSSPVSSAPQLGERMKSTTNSNWVASKKQQSMMDGHDKGKDTVCVI